MYIAFNTTKLYKNSKVLLEHSGKEVFTDLIDISPARPYEKEIDFPENAKMEDLKISLISSDGDVLIDYQKKPPKPFAPPKMKKQVGIDELLAKASKKGRYGYVQDLIELKRRYGKAEPIKSEMSIDELSVRADERERLSHVQDAIDLYNEILKREDDHTLANNNLGIIKLKRSFFAEAENHFSKAIEKSPDWRKPYFYLGQSLLYQDKIDEAYNVFYRSTYDMKFFSQGNYYLGLIDCLKKDYKTAVKHFSDAISLNQLFTKAYLLKAAA